jgi:serine/threonine protein kinase
MGLLAQGLGYCHSKGVFHRHLDAGRVLVAPDWNDLRLSGFGFAKDVDWMGTLTVSEMQQRDPRLIPPEESAGLPVENYRTYDMYQLGVLFYRMLESGAWPREPGVGMPLREMTRHIGECGIEPVRSLVQAMLAEDPKDRPDLMDKVEKALRNVLPA